MNVAQFEEMRAWGLAWLEKNIQLDSKYTTLKMAELTGHALLDAYAAGFEAGRKPEPIILRNLP